MLVGVSGKTLAAASSQIWGQAIALSGELLLMNVAYVAELIWLAKLGETALAAVSIAGIVRWLFNSVGMGLSLGAMAIVARRIGEGDRRAASGAGGQAITITLVCMSLLAALGWFGARTIVLLLGARGLVAQEATSFLQVFFLGLPVISMVNVTSTLLRGAGRPRKVLVLAATRYLIPLGLQPLLISGFAGWPGFAVIGAPLALIIGNGLALVPAIQSLRSEDVPITIRLSGLSLDLPTARAIVTIGVPSMFQLAVAAISSLIAVKLVAHFGTASHIAGYGVADRVFWFFLSIITGIGNGCGVLVGQRLGSGHSKEAETISWVGLGYGMLIPLAALAFFGLLNQPLVRLLTESAVAAEAMKWYFLLVVPSWIPGAMTVVLGKCFSGAGNTLPPMVVEIVARCGLLVLLGILLGSQAGYQGVYLGMAIANSVSGFWSVLWFRQGRWKLVNV